MDSSEIIRDIQIVCKCKGVKYKTIKKAIKEGATTIEKVKAKTRANTGCGKQCTRKIKDMITEHLTEKLEEN